MIFIIAFTVIAVVLIVTAIKTPVWKIVWLLLLVLTMFVLPRPAMVVSPVVIAIILTIKKKLDTSF